jgi:hypothetical protein
MNHRIEVVWVVQYSRSTAVGLLSWSLTRVLVSPRSLSGKVWRFKNFRAIKDLCLNCVWLQSNIKTPLLNFFTGWNHLVKFANRFYTIVRFLEKTLPHSGHCLFIFSNFLRDSDKHTEFWGQINILSLLLNFKQRLVETHNLLVILRTEVLDHGNCLTSLSLFKAASFWTHIPAYCTDFVGFVMTVASHNNCMFEFVINGFLGLGNFWRLSGISLSFSGKSDHLFIDQL